MKGLQLSEPVRLYSRRKLLSLVLFLVTNFSAILVPAKTRQKHAQQTHDQAPINQKSSVNILFTTTCAKSEFSYLILSGSDF